MTATPDRLAPAPASLAQADLDHYEENGYVVFRDVLSPDEVQAVSSAMTRVVLEALDGLELGTYGRRDGRPDSNHNMSGGVLFDKESRFSVQLESAVDPTTLDATTAPVSYRKLANFIGKDPAFAALEDHPRLKGYRDALLGPDSIRFQDMALSKPAHIGVAKPWHQDNAYFSVTPLDQVMGIWIAIDDATVENGCMHVIPTARRDLTAHKHIHRTDCEIAEDDLPLDRAKAIEVPAGGALFFLGMLPHFTPVNRSPHGRRALQLHYRGADTVNRPAEEYNEVFATPDGRPASCSA